MWILLALLAAGALITLLLYRRNRAAKRRWQVALAESERSHRPETITRPGVRRTAMGPIATGPQDDPAPSSMMFDDRDVFSPVSIAFANRAVDDEEFKGRGGAFGGAGASGSWDAPSAPEPSPAPDPSPDPSSTCDSSSDGGSCGD